jgi:hypothetical protein
MADPKNSPAVQSMEIEQAEQRERAVKNDLDTGLEDSFPASVKSIEAKIRERPIAAVAVVAALAFIFGATR